MCPDFIYLWYFCTLSQFLHHIYDFYPFLMICSQYMCEKHKRSKKVSGKSRRKKQRRCLLKKQRTKNIGNSMEEDALHMNGNYQFSCEGRISCLQCCELCKRSCSCPVRGTECNQVFTVP